MGRWLRNLGSPFRAGKGMGRRVLGHPVIRNQGSRSRGIRDRTPGRLAIRSRGIRNRTIRSRVIRSRVVLGRVIRRRVIPSRVVLGRVTRSHVIRSPVVPGHVIHSRAIRSRAVLGRVIRRRVIRSRAVPGRVIRRHVIPDPVALALVIPIRGSPCLVIPGHLTFRHRRRCGRRMPLSHRGIRRGCPVRFRRSLHRSRCRVNYLLPHWLSCRRRSVPVPGSGRVGRAVIRRLRFRWRSEMWRWGRQWLDRTGRSRCR